MKKKFLLHAAVMMGLTTLAQQGSPGIRSSMVDMADEYSVMLERMNNAEKNATAKSPVKGAVNVQPVFKKSNPLAPIVWNPISASMNVYGVLYSSSKPLHYNNE